MRWLAVIFTAGLAVANCTPREEPPPCHDAILVPPEAGILTCPDARQNIDATGPLIVCRCWDTR